MTPRIGAKSRWQNNNALFASVESRAVTSLRLASTHKTVLRLFRRKAIQLIPTVAEESLKEP